MCSICLSVSFLLELYLPCACIDQLPCNSLKKYTIREPKTTGLSGQVSHNFTWFLLADNIRRPKIIIMLRLVFMGNPSRSNDLAYCSPKLQTSTTSSDIACAYIRCVCFVVALWLLPIALRVTGMGTMVI